MKRLLLAILFLGSLASAQVLQMEQGGTGVTACGGPNYVLTCKSDLSGWQGAALGAGSWLNSVVMPNDMFNTSISGITGIETVTKANMSPGYVFRGPSLLSFNVPFIVQAPVPCTSTVLTASQPCTFATSTTAGNTIFVSANTCSDPTDCLGSTGGGFSALSISDGVNSYISLDATSGSSVPRRSWYAKNIAGGPVTVTVSLTGGTTAINIVEAEIGNVDATAPLGQHAMTHGGFNTSSSCPGESFPSITTTAANEIVLGAVNIAGGELNLGAGVGYNLQVASSISSPHYSAALVYKVVNGIGSFTPKITGCGYHDNDDYFTVSFKASANGGGLNQYSAGPITFPMLGIAAFPGSAGSTPSYTEGDSGFDFHIGTPIYAEDVLTAYAGTDTASTLYVVPSGATQGLLCTVYVDCGTQVSGATVVPELLFTGHSSHAEKLTGEMATCTSLGNSDVSTQVWPIRAQGGTTVYLKTTIANSPDYDVSAGCSLQSTK